MGIKILNPSGDGYTKDETDALIEASREYISVINYSALPDVTTVTDQLFVVEYSQGTAWLPGGLGGDFYAKGIYYSNGIEWVYMGNAPIQATQVEVTNAIRNDVFITPLTLGNNNYNKTEVDNALLLKGDMEKSIYDTTNNGIVDNSEKVNNLSVETAVPISAVFTDTIYDDTIIQAEVDLNTAKVGITPTQTNNITTNNTKRTYPLVDENKLVTIENNAQVNTVDSVNSKTGDVVINKTDVGLSNVNNTSDLLKPISTDGQNALDGKVDKVTGKELSDNNFSDTDKTAVINNTAKVTNATHTGDVTGDTVLAIGTNKVLENMLSSDLQLKIANGNHLNNLVATTDPTVNDDSSIGYSAGSVWINQSTTEAYRCLLDDVGNAIWQNTTLTASEVAIMIDNNTQVVANTTARHTHSNKSILDNTTASFTAAEKINISNQSGTNTGDQDLSGLISKTTNVDQSVMRANLTTGEIEDSLVIIDDLGNVTATDYNVVGNNKTLKEAVGDRNYSTKVFLENTKRSFTGGGDISYTNNRELKWSALFRSISVGRSSETATGASFTISMPPQGTVIHGVDNQSDVVVNQDGIALPTYSCLWYDLPLGGNYASVDNNFYISKSSKLTGDSIPDTFILVAAVASDNNDHLDMLARGIIIRGATSWEEKTITPTFQNGWVNYDSASYGPVTIKRFNNQVFIQGLIKSGTIGTTAFDLPVGFRPSVNLIFATVSTSSFAELRINQSGAVLALSGSNVWYSVSCTFYI